MRSVEAVQPFWRQAHLVGHSRASAALTHLPGRVIALANGPTLRVGHAQVREAQQAAASSPGCAPPSRPRNPLVEHVWPHSTPPIAVAARTIEQVQAEAQAPLGPVCMCDEAHCEAELRKG